MGVIASILVALVLVSLMVLAINLAATWWEGSEQRDRDRRAAEAERERAELKVAMLRFQTETNAAAHEARKALIAEALHFGQGNRQLADPSEEGSR